MVINLSVIQFTRLWTLLRTHWRVLVNSPRHYINIRNRTIALFVLPQKKSKQSLGYYSPACFKVLPSNLLWKGNRDSFPLFCSQSLSGLTAARDVWRPALAKNKGRTRERSFMAYLEKRETICYKTSINESFSNRD